MLRHKHYKIDDKILSYTHKTSTHYTGNNRTINGEY